MPEDSRQPISRKDLLTFKDLAELTGMSLPTVRFWHRARLTPPSVLIGVQIRFPRDLAEQWLAAGGALPKPSLTVPIEENYIVTD
jgi:hypothetical protein